MVNMTSLNNNGKYDIIDIGERQALFASTPSMFQWPFQAEICQQKCQIFQIIEYPQDIISFRVVRYLSR